MMVAWKSVALVRLRKVTGLEALEHSKGSDIGGDCDELEEKRVYMLF